MSELYTANAGTFDRDIVLPVNTEPHTAESIVPAIKRTIDYCAKNEEDIASAGGIWRITSFVLTGPIVYPDVAAESTHYESDGDIQLPVGVDPEESQVLHISVANSRTLDTEDLEYSSILVYASDTPDEQFVEGAFAKEVFPGESCMFYWNGTEWRTL
jgi:hypothetical protein